MKVCLRNLALQHLLWYSFTIRNQRVKQKYVNRNTSPHIFSTCENYFSCKKAYLPPETGVSSTVTPKGSTDISKSTQKQSLKEFLGVFQSHLSFWDFQSEILFPDIWPLDTVQPLKMFILNSETLFTEATRGLLYKNSNHHFCQSGIKDCLISLVQGSVCVWIITNAELKENCSIPRLSTAGKISKCDSFFSLKAWSWRKKQDEKEAASAFSSNQPCVLVYKARQEGNMRIRQAARWHCVKHLCITAS